MADLLSGGVTRGLVGAAASMKTAQVCMSVYSAAKARKDEETMKRALGYASDNMGDAMESTDESRAALKENIEAVREEEKADQASRLEKARQETTEKRSEAWENTKEDTNKTVFPTDIVEISSEATAALKNKLSSPEAQIKGTTNEGIEQHKKQEETPKIATQIRQNTQDVHPEIDSGENEEVKRVKLDIKV